MITDTYRKCDTEKFRLNSSFACIKDVPLYKLYHCNSELNEKNQYLFTAGIKKALNDPDFLDKCAQKKDFYFENESVVLPEPNKNLASGNVFDTIEARRSIRDFSKESISIEEFSTILYFSSGFTGVYKETDEKSELDLLAYPSAGGLYPLNLFIFINNVEGIERGIYYYNPIKNILKKVRLFSDYDEYMRYTLSKKIAVNAAFIVYIIGSMDLTGYKYSDRGYRFMILEAGHIAQNLYLTSTAVRAGTVASGGFLDYELKKSLNLEDDYVLYEILIGRPNKNSTDCRFISK